MTSFFFILNLLKYTIGRNSQNDDITLIDKLHLYRSSFSGRKRPLIYVYDFDDTKSDSSERDISLFPNTVTLLEKHFEKQNEHPDFPRIRFHDLRHTHATLLLKAGIHPKIVQERLGHSSINVTLDTYSHVLSNMQEAVLRSIGDSITGTKIEAENPLYLDKG